MSAPDLKKARDVARKMDDRPDSAKQLSDYAEGKKVARQVIEALRAGPEPRLFLYVCFGACAKVSEYAGAGFLAEVSQALARSVDGESA